MHARPRRWSRFSCRTLLILITGLIVGWSESSTPHRFQARELNFEERVEAQRAIEAVYWRHRIWPESNPGPKPPLSQVMPDEAIRAKVEDDLARSRALERYWQRPLTAKQLQAEMDRMARNTRNPEMLRELFAALGHDPHLIAECLARPALAGRLIRNWYARDTRFHGELRARVEDELASTGVRQMRSLSGEYSEVEVVPVAGDGEEERRRHRPGQEAERASSADPHSSGSQGIETLSAPRRLELAPEEWRHYVGKLAGRLGRPEDPERWMAGDRLDAVTASPTISLPDTEQDPDGVEILADALPMGRLSGLIEENDHFVVQAVLQTTERGFELATMRWPKRPFDDWWKVARSDLYPRRTGVASARLRESRTATATAQPSDSFQLPAMREETCVPGTWTQTHFDPAARVQHTAVWTGAEMIVWGDYPRAGSRYDPATDTWRQIATSAVVATRRWGHTAVWTGTEMIVWGGRDSDLESVLPWWKDRTSKEVLLTGGRYDPLTDSWRPVSTGENVPAARWLHTAVWTGSEMIVWGGDDGSEYYPFTDLNSGGRYDPVTDSWEPTSIDVNVPSARNGHTAVWTGSEMIVWGGRDNSNQDLNTGGRYDPLTNSWTPTSIGVGVPSERRHHTAVWTGTEMIVWGGRYFDGTYIKLDTGSRYDPSVDSWSLTSTGAHAPSARVYHTAVWTGAEMIVWGGSDSSGQFINTGGRYSPSTDDWVPTSIVFNAPSGRKEHSAVWTGNEMIVWGGRDNSDQELNTGGRYDLSADSWVPTSTGVNVPSARYRHTAVWTGAEMIIWGGYHGSSLNTGGRYDSSIDSWSPTSIGANVPSERRYHTAVWTGTEMIVWGGDSLSTGGRYNVSTDSWAPTSTGANIPSWRREHTAVWTGTEMIVWGGYGSSDLNTGGRYDPAADTWAPTSIGGNVPSARYYHTAVWTGTEMIVWGGSHGSGLNTGGRYAPETDTWQPTSTGANVPSERRNHTAVWTGTEMIVWGGFFYPSFYDRSVEDTGGRYDPSADSWVPTSTGANVPSARYSHTAVWTGEKVIIWGGTPDWGVGTGGRYQPTTDNWEPMPSGSNTPAARGRHKAVWTGTEMIIWGGEIGGLIHGTGGRYCACLETLWYEDADGDGHGDTAVPECAAVQPPGSVTTAGDCDETSDALWGAPEPVHGLMFEPDLETLSWSAPADPGGAMPVYDVIRTEDPSDLVLGAICFETDDGADRTATDSSVPPVGGIHYYVVRAETACGKGPADIRPRLGPEYRLVRDCP